MLIEVIETDFFDHPSYLLIYAAFVDELLEFDTPSSEMSDERVIIPQEAFIQQYEAGNKRLMSMTIKRGWARLNVVEM